MIEWLKLHKSAVGAGLVFVLFVGSLLLIGAIDSCRSNRSEDKREEQREQLGADSQVLRRSAEVKDARAQEREREREQLKAEADKLRAEIERLKAERKKASRKYEARENEIDNISDYITLRKRNCADRARLGYPCPD